MSNNIYQILKKKLDENSCFFSMAVMDKKQLYWDLIFISNVKKNIVLMPSELIIY